MKKNLVKNYNDLSTPIQIIIGITVSCLIGTISSIILSILFSYVISRSPVISNFISLYFIISVVFGAFVCGFLSSKLLKFKGIISGLISAFSFILLILLIMLIASNGSLSPYVILLVLFVVLFSIVGGIVSANMKRRK